MIKVKLEALDGYDITPRTGKSIVEAQTASLPQEGGYQIFLYTEKCDSPGVAIATDGVERLGNEIKFFDFNKRAFKITIL